MKELIFGSGMSVVISAIGELVTVTTNCQKKFNTLEVML